jgi:citronellol/citronellal dehydrogenase
MAAYFGALGALVAIVGRREEMLRRTAADLCQQGIEVLSHAADVRDVASVEAAVEAVYAKFGRLDVLINNAGGQFPQHALDITPKGFDAVVRTNLYGTVQMTQAVARRMALDGGGAIVNIVVSSLERGIPGVAHTVAARAGVLGYMRTVAREWGPYRIRINAIGPGLVDTPGFRQEMIETGDPDVMARTLKAVPLGRLGKAEDVAALAAFLASPAASYLTGQYIPVDGGNGLAEGISVLPPER